MKGHIAGASTGTTLANFSSGGQALDTRRLTAEQDCGPDLVHLKVRRDNQQMSPERDWRLVSKLLILGVPPPECSNVLLQHGQ